MNLDKTHIVIIILLFLSFFKSFGQDISYEIISNPKLVLKAKSNSNSIMLRWGVDDKRVWKHAIANGFIIERATISRDGNPLKTSEKIILNNGPIKPLPLKDWGKIIEDNDMAAVVAQAIYGERFNVNEDNENLVMQIVNESSELQQRFGFSMFAVDQSFIASQYAGLGFIDKNIKDNERYLYTIELVDSENKFNIKEAGVLISPSELPELPKPYDFVGYYYNDAFVLIWEYDDLKNSYNAYDIEKSEDGITFSIINEAPITKLSDSKTSGISFTDSIPQYEKKYWYRIKGKTIFDEIGPSSDTISVIAYKKLLVAPEFIKNTILSDTEVELKWTLAKDEAWKLTGFDLLRAEKAIGPYTAVQENLSATATSFNYKNLKEINYFKIRAKGIAGDFQSSSPTMVQPVDSVPPVQPIGLKGTIDTLGIVRLNWIENKELDLKGYTVFKANRPNQEFTRLTKQELTTNSFVDTINIKTFNKNVYYKIIAADNRYNESIASEVVVLRRPNKIPPASPVFSGYEIIGDSIKLQWINSSSDFIEKHILYRRNLSKDNDDEWENITEISDLNVELFYDTTTISNTKYLYIIVAINVSGLESQPSPPLSISTRGNLLKPQIKNISSIVDRENKFIQLNWRYNEGNITEIQLFRKVSDQSKFTLYQTFDGTTKQFTDRKLYPNTNYTYGFKVIFNDGSTSKWNELKVTY